MKQKLEAGSSIDVLTSGELASETQKILDALRNLSIESFVMDVETVAQATAAGTIVNFEVYEVPLGHKCEIHRIHVNAPGATPAAPFAPAGGWLGFYRNDVTPLNLFMGLPSGSTAIAPVQITEGSDARVLYPGNRIILSGAALGANQFIYVALQLTLRPFERGVND